MRLLPLWERAAAADDAACRSSTRKSPMTIRSFDADPFGPVLVGLGDGTRGISGRRDECMASDDDRSRIIIIISDVYACSVAEEEEESRYAQIIIIGHRISRTKGKRAKMRKKKWLNPISFIL